MKNGLINGLLAGLVSVVLFFIFNAIDPKLNFSMTYGLLASTVIYMIFMIRAGFQERKDMGGYLKFGEAFLITLVTFAIGSLINNVFLYIMMGLNPELLEVAMQTTMEATESTLRMAGMSEDQIALALEEQENNLDAAKVYSLKNIFVSYLSGFVLGLIYILIASVITKKNEPAA